MDRFEVEANIERLRRSLQGRLPLPVAETVKHLLAEEEAKLARLNSDEKV